MRMQQKLKVGLTKRAESGGEDAEPPGSDTEQEEEWEQLVGQGRAVRGRTQVLDKGQEIAPAEAVVERAGESGRAKTQGDKVATESYKKRHMRW